MKLYKKVNKAGGITIPQQLRHALNIPKGAALELEDDGDKIIITKHTPTCPSSVLHGLFSEKHQTCRHSVPGCLLYR